MAKATVDIDVKVTTLGDLEKKMKSLNEKIKDVGVNSKEFKKLSNELKETQAASNKAKESLKETGDITSLIGGKAGAAFGAMKSGIGKVITSFGTLKGAIISSGIGALALAVLAVGKAFTSSEEGQNKFAKLMGVIGSVTGNVVDVISDLGEFIIDVFSGEGEAIKSLKEFGSKIFDVIGLPIKNAITIVKSLANSFSALVSGDFSGAFDALEKGAYEVGANFKQAGDVIVEGFTAAKDAIVEFGEEALREADIAAKIADARAQADKTAREILVENAEAQLKITKLRAEAADKENTTAQERIAALQEAQAIQEEITEKELANAQILYDAKVAENALSKSTKEDLDEEAQLRANLFIIQQKQFALQKATAAQISANQKEINAQAEKEAAEAQKKLDEELAAEEKRQESIDAIRKKYDEKRRDDEAETEEQKLELQKQRELERLDALNASEEERANIIAYWDNKILENKEEIATQEEQLQKQKLDTASGVVDGIAGLASRESEIGKTLFLAKQALSIAAMVQEIQSVIFFGKTSVLKAQQKAAEATVDIAGGAAKTASVGFPQNIPLLIGYGVQAAAIGISIGKAIKQSKETDKTIPGLPAEKKPQVRTQFATGGYVQGPGTETSDSINARLSNGEYVVNAESTKRNLELLERINNTPQKFADGGLVSTSSDYRMTNVLERIDRRLNTVPKAYVVSTEIQDSLDTDAYLERRAELTN